MPPIGSKVKHDCPKLILWLLKGHAYWKRREKVEGVPITEPIKIAQALVFL
jgi:hypothetical protein